MENPEKEKLVKKILTDRLKHAEKSLADYEKQLSEAQADPKLSRNPEYMGALQYPIGFMHGVKNELELVLAFMGMSLIEIETWLHENDEEFRRNKQNLELIKTVLLSTWEEEE